MKKIILVTGFLMAAVSAAAAKKHHHAEVSHTQEAVNAAIDARLHAMLVKLNAQNK
jgi:hypothetical protein